ncbi:tartrate dehydrogenase [Halobacillus sp. Marseille-Q1614]|uniref:tartrate dehydrogenase n=1 Tax=Halobacillus sp. Marseille-Q1614 TaxID=2709134 RepID=UPI00157036BB|nr:tartrate dehydrogenase [Halobacillus sp. Marseille-Q1614]
MRNYNIAVIPGDGIGKEVVPVTLDVLNHAAEVFDDVSFNFTEFPWGCDYYLEHGKMMADDGIEQLEKFDAILLGAVGDPERVPDHISLWGLLIKIRREMDQSLNIRPAKHFKGLESPLANPGDFDIMVVRENSEGEYSEVGGRIHRGQDEMAIQNAVFTRKASERAIRYGFKLASERRGKLTSATKSNGIVHSMPFWDEIFAEISDEFPDVMANKHHIDALAAFFVSKPQEFDVIVASNLFGDILTDIGGAIMGSIGIAPAANLNMTGEHPSMFEPVHGSAPDIYGKGIANPIGQIWTAKMMLDHLGESKMAESILAAVEETTAAGVKTGDIGGHATTVEVANEVCKHIKR